ncbi:UNVERIFIED_CONTAM: hypothetical protein GTU68_005034 [Idotea baltica]|nr:hypothetical protein [Idotea baltica]
MVAEAHSPGFCRACYARFDTLPTDRRCRTCRAPRLLSHPELNTLSIAHIDCDAFYASVEKRDDPSLADKALIIGGGRRGVVSTACYIARLSGVRSAMPMFKALKLCPDAVVLPPCMDKYVEVSREIRAMILSLTPLVEPLSLDEAFLDLTGTERLHSGTPAMSLAKLVERIETETGITASVGLSDCKFLAKIASDLDKPRGFSVIGRGEALDFLEDKPVSMIWGVGGALNAKLKKDGVLRIGDLRQLAQTDLVARYGSMGLRLHNLSHANDTRSVDPRSKMKSVSAETTLSEDLDDPDLLRAHLWQLAEKVSARCKAKDIAGHTITLKLKTADFQIVTRSATQDTPTQLADVIYNAAERPLSGLIGPQAYRLIGVGLSTLVPAEQARDGAGSDLFDPDAPKRAQAERAVDAIREKFGRNAVEKGLGWRLRDDPE